MKAFLVAVVVLYIVATQLVVAIGWAHWGLFLGVYGLSLVGFLMFASDKDRAENGNRRISEASLLIVSALGGWPGGLMAMATQNHKTSKGSFLWKMAGVAVLNVLVTAVVVWVIKDRTTYYYIKVR